MSLLVGRCDQTGASHAGLESRLRVDKDGLTVRSVDPGQREHKCLRGIAEQHCEVFVGGSDRDALVFTFNIGQRYLVVDDVVVPAFIEPKGALSLLGDVEWLNVVLGGDGLLNSELADKLDRLSLVVVVPEGDDEILSDVVFFVTFRFSVLAFWLHVITFEDTVANTWERLVCVYKVHASLRSIGLACLVFILVEGLAAVIEDVLLLRDLSLVTKKGLHGNVFNFLLLLLLLVCSTFAFSFAKVVVDVLAIAEFDGLQTLDLLHRDELRMVAGVVDQLQELGLLKGNLVVCVTITVSL